MTATNRQASTSVRCVASRSRSYPTYASTATCTARPSMRATSVVVASAGPPTSRFIARLAAGKWRRVSNYRRMVKAGCCGVSVVCFSVLSSTSLCLVWMTVKKRTTCFEFACMVLFAHFLMWPIITKTISHCLFRLRWM